MAGEMAKFASNMDFGMVLRIAYWFTLGWRYGPGYTHTRVGVKRSPGGDYFLECGESTFASLVVQAG